MEGRIRRDDYKTEGRIRREDLISSGSTANSGSHVAPPGRRYQRGTGRSTANSYRKRSHTAKNELIPEGRDLLIVQILASGLLLLFVMFVAIVDTEGTLSIRKKLSSAFSKKTTIAEVTDSIMAARDKLAGSADTVFEIFGGELNTSKDGDTDINASDGAADGDTLPELGTDGATVDPETLKQLSDYAEDYSKN